ncbi:hypothetical protein STCU_07273 [Strigomonas culicis]|nr:hypothetical protein STCU_07273 [Strigomonas culicis]|eukprot:EPY24252.1 hypothetical protein STCU_07273 [Strigomonas culicis]
MTDFKKVAVPVSVCTNVVPLKPAAIDMTTAELAECFQNARRSNVHTQPVISNPKEIKKAIERLDGFHSSQLNRFLYGYMYPNSTIPNYVLNEIRTFCVNVDSEWVSKCQNVAAGVLVRELHTRAANIIPRASFDDPIALAQLRRSLPAIKHVPKVSIQNMHFKFVGNFSTDPDANTKIYTARVKLMNNGNHSIIIEVTQTQTVIDGISVDNRYVESTLQKQELKRGESIDVNFSIREAPRRGFSDFQQLVVLTIDGVIRYFITLCVVSPRQKIFGQRFPSCLPLRVEHSPLGPYAAPMMLQLLKHQLLRQQGLSSPAVVHLFTDRSVNFRPHNQETMREVMRVKELLEEQMNLLDILDSFWNSQPDAKKAPIARRYQPPCSAAQPAGYLPGVDLPTVGSTSGMVTLFPNAATRVPDVLSRAPPAVTAGVILLVLAEMEMDIFDASFLNCDALSYFESMTPHYKGVILWVLDLCCALLFNKAVNGCTERGLALTFASVLARPMRASRKAADDDDAPVSTEAFEAAADPSATRADAAEQITFPVEVAHRQNIVTALLAWLAVYQDKFTRNA